MKLIVLSLFFLFSFIYCSTNYGESIILEHSLQPGEWSPRGTITYKSITNTLAGSRAAEPPTLEQIPLSSEEINLLNKLVKRDEFYSIRIKIGENKYIKSSIKACSLISSELRDFIGLHMSQQGDLISLNYWTKTIECSNELINSGRFDSFTTEINIKFGTSGGLPKLAAPKVEPEPAKKQQQQEQQEEPGFFSKYWMYILIGVVFLNVLPMLTGSQEFQPNQARGNAARRPAAN